MNETEQAEQEWKVWEINDYDTWLGRNRLEVLESVFRYYGWTLPDVVTEETLGAIGEAEGLFELEFVQVLSEAEMDRRRIWLDGNTDPYALEHWQCECGAMADNTCRWNGDAWEHHHGYPVGHVQMKNIHHLTFREHLAQRLVEGPEVSVFSSSEV